MDVGPDGHLYVCIICSRSIIQDSYKIDYNVSRPHSNEHLFIIGCTVIFRSIQQQLSGVFASL
jgi:hypothetical protein